MPQLLGCYGQLGYACLCILNAFLDDQQFVTLELILSKVRDGSRGHSSKQWVFGLCRIGRLAQSAGLL